MKHRPLISLLLFALAPAASFADVIVYGTRTDHPLVPGASLTDVRMSVDMAVSDGVATLTFTNTSTGLETSAVIKEIVLRGYEEAGGEALLWDGKVVTDTEEVAYDLGTSNGLPGYAQLTGGEYPLTELQAKPSPVKRGIGPGEQLEVQFKTSLDDGATMTDYLDMLSGTSDPPYVVGFHAISASTLDGESLSGVVVPEPAALALLGMGGILVGLMPRRK